MGYTDISYMTWIKSSIKTIIAVYLPLLIIGLLDIMLLITRFFLEYNQIGYWLNKVIIIFVYFWLLPIFYFYINYINGDLLKA